MADEFLLKEDGDDILLEDGSSKLILEESEAVAIVAWRPVWTNRRQS